MSSSRRDFLRQAASAATLTALPGELLGQSLAQPFPATHQSNPSSANDKKIGYCIVGLGRISMNEFMPGVRLSQRSKIVALVSGHRPKADRIAAQYGVVPKAI
jgi:hypothetical protein